MKPQILILVFVFNIIGYSQTDYTIVPFQSICGIIPGKTRVDEAIKKLGSPEKIEYKKVILVTKTYKYPKLGLTFIVEGEEINKKNGIINEIGVTSPFQNTANINFQIGMPKEKAIKFLTQKYDCVRDNIDSTYSLFKLNKNTKLIFLLGFKNNALESISIYPLLTDEKIKEQRLLAEEDLAKAKKALWDVENLESVEESKDVGTVVEKYLGNGATNTRPFHIDSSWEVKWNAKGEYFSISLYTTDNEMLDVLANQSGSGEGSSFYPKKGNYFFKVNALGDWEIEVIKLK